MPRDNSGNYVLPALNPVSANTVIESAWANSTMSDVATTLTQSLDRSGRGTMLAALKLIDGAQAQPALTFNAEASSGLYRAGTHDLRMSVGGVDMIKLTDAGAAFPAGLSGLFVDGTAALPSISFKDDTDTGLWRQGANALSVSAGGAEVARLSLLASSGPTLVVGGGASVGNAAVNRSLVEISGVGDSVLALAVNAAKVGYLQASPTRVTLGTQNPGIPITLVQNGIERARLTEATAQAELLVGTTTSTLSSANRGLIAVNGSSQSYFAFDVNGVNKGFIGSNGTLSSVATPSGIPLTFNYAGTEIARIDTDSTFRYQGQEVGWKGLPFASRSPGYVVLATDAGKCISVSSAGNVVLAAVFSAGDTLNILNNTAAGVVGINPNGAVTIKWNTGGGLVSSNSAVRSIAANGLVTLYFTAANTATLTGTGIS